MGAAAVLDSSELARALELLSDIIATHEEGRNVAPPPSGATTTAAPDNTTSVVLALSPESLRLVRRIRNNILAESVRGRPCSLAPDAFAWAAGVYVCV